MHPSTERQRDDLRPHKNFFSINGISPGYGSGMEYSSHFLHLWGMKSDQNHAEENNDNQ